MKRRRNTIVSARRSAFTLLAGGVGLSLSALVLALSGARTAADEFYPLMDAVIARMHAGMHVAPSGDPDRDFARMMVPHHQGAIDMARLELQFGKDEACGVWPRE